MEIVSAWSSLELDIIETAKVTLPYHQRIRKQNVKWKSPYDKIL